MLIETDSPYLSPDPFREKSNEPANVKIVAENVALIKEISFEDVANITTKNFKDFFFNE
jgi:TatD DNase family protein